MGWVKFRASRTLECHLGGTPQVIDGQDVIFVRPAEQAGRRDVPRHVAPLPPPKGEIYAPGCTVS